MALSNKDVMDKYRQNGFKVKVRHTRRLKKPVFNPEIGGEDYFLTKGEFYNLTPTGSIFGDYIESRGGFTEVTLVSPDGSEFRAKYNFPKDKMFNLRIGLTAALGRLQKVK